MQNPEGIGYRGGWVGAIMEKDECLESKPPPRTGQRGPPAPHLLPTFSAGPSLQLALWEGITVPFYGNSSGVQVAYAA